MKNLGNEYVSKTDKRKSDTGCIVCCAYFVVAVSTHSVSCRDPQLDWHAHSHVLPECDILGVT